MWVLPRRAARVITVLGMRSRRGSILSRPLSYGGCRGVPAFVRRTRISGLWARGSAKSDCTKKKGPRPAEHLAWRCCAKASGSSRLLVALARGSGVVMNAKAETLATQVRACPPATGHGCRHMSKSARAEMAWVFRVRGSTSPAPGPGTGSRPAQCWGNRDQGARGSGPYSRRPCIELGSVGTWVNGPQQPAGALPAFSSPSSVQMVVLATSHLSLW